MPELPEVETVRRVLETRLVGRKIAGCALLRPTFYRKPPAGALQGLRGTTVESVRRRGKYLMLALSGNRELSLHLGMSGRLDFGARGPHTRFEILFDGEAVRFHDARRFGRVGCALPELGPEPLSAEFGADYLWKALRGRKARLKAALMDQALVAGLGNIYATEALFKAGLRPGRRAGGLTRAQAERLCAAIKEVLKTAVELRGSTLEDEAFLDPTGRAGLAQKALCVYGRRVGSCGHRLKATPRPISGRTSLFCPICQK